MSGYCNNLDELFEKKCNCGHCDSAVSPLAYLSALIDYVIQNVKIEGNPDSSISLEYLESAFFQNFGGLPVKCKEFDRQICQFRIAIEVLREYVNTHNYNEEEYNNALKNYLLMAYSELLETNGISFNTLKNVLDKNMDEQRKVAERIGILLKSNGVSNLESLWLDPDSDPEILTELSLEKIFGLIDTEKNPYSHGVKLMDNGDILIRWRFYGLEWNLNTDIKGYIYLNVSVSGNETSLNIYKDENRTELIASGIMEGTTGAMFVYPENNSRLTAEFYLENAVNNNEIKVSLVPLLLSLKLEFLYHKFALHHEPENVFFNPEIENEIKDNAVPVIEPDIIGPADIIIKKEGHIVYKIWKHRRLWLDDNINELKTFLNANEIFEYLEDNISYSAAHLGSTISNVEIKPFSASPHFLYNGLLNGKDRNVIEDRILQNLHLEPSTFKRLYDLYLKYRESTNLSEEENQDEINELIGISTISIKRAFYKTWIEEELESIEDATHGDKDPLELSTEFFQISDIEPIEGTWPPVIDEYEPLLEPDKISLNQVYEIPGNTSLWAFHARIESNRNAYKAIKKEYEQNGFLEMLVLGFGNPPLDKTGNEPSNYPIEPEYQDLRDYLDSLFEKLNDTDEEVVNGAKLDIVNYLHITHDQFIKLMNYVVNNDLGQNLSEQQLDYIFSVLVKSYKIRKLYPEWKSKEVAYYTDTNENFQYWFILKHSLPVYGNLEVLRKKWEEGLEIVQRTPLIEPEVITRSHFRYHFENNNLPYTIFKERENWFQNSIDEIKNHRENLVPEPPANFYTDIALNNTYGNTRRIEIVDNKVYITRHIFYLTVYDLKEETETVLLDSNNGLDNPRDVISLNGLYFYVLDSHVNKSVISKYNASWELIWELDAQGSGDGEFAFPSELALDSKGNLFVVERDNHRFQKLDSNGNFIFSVGKKDQNGDPVSGQNPGEFNNPVAIKTDKNDRVYIVDRDNHRLQVFDSQGNFLYQIGKTAQAGNANDELDSPIRIIIDFFDNIYILDGSNNNRILVYSNEGEYISTFDQDYFGDMSELNITGIDIDKHGRVFLAYNTSGADSFLRFFDPFYGIGLTLKEYTGIDLYTFSEILRIYNNEIDISKHLDGIGVSYTGFNRIVKACQEALKNNLEDNDNTLFLFYKTIGRLKKRAEYIKWRNEESEEKIFLNPIDFVLPVIELDDENDAFTEETSFLIAQENWENILKTRINEQKSLIDQYGQMLSNVDDHVLMILRDGLVMSVIDEEAGESLESKGNWMSKRLLIDMKTNCCMQTNRIAQAIQTLQTLIKSIRTHQMVEVNEDKLLLDFETFDNDWRWLGSYENWRSLMFVFLYPENILMPNFKALQSPAFRELNNEIENLHSYNDKVICEVISKFDDYIRDIINLQTVNSIYADINYPVDNGDCSKSNIVVKRGLFIFAKSENSGKIYWSIAHTKWSGQFEQTFWKPLPSSGNHARVCGSVWFRNAVHNYVAIYYTENEKFYVQKFDLHKRIWLDEAVELELINEINTSTLIVEDRIQVNRRPIVTAINSENLIFVRLLNDDGVSWKDGEWQNVYGNNFNKEEGTLYAKSIFKVVGIYSTLKLFFIAYSDGYSFLFVDWSVKDKIWSFVNSGDPNSTTSVRYVCDQLKKDHINNVSQIISIINYYKYPENNKTNEYGIVYKGSDDKTYIIKITLTIYNNKDVTAELGDSIIITPSHITYFGPFRGISSKAPKQRYLIQATDTLHAMMINEMDTNFQTGQMGIFYVLQRALTPKMTYMGGNATKLTDSELQIKRQDSYSDFNNNSNINRMNLVYVEEAYYFVPMLIAFHLRRLGKYKEALDWYRTIYNYSTSVNKRKIYYGLIAEENAHKLIDRLFDWIKDQHNPHHIAGLRPDSYTLFTIQQIITTIIEYADAEFTIDTSESLPRARMLYLTALEIMNDSVFTDNMRTCMDYVNELDSYVLKAPEDYINQWNQLKNDIRHIQSSDKIHKPDDPDNTLVFKLKEILINDTLSWDERMEDVYDEIWNFIKEEELEESLKQKKLRQLAKLDEIDDCLAAKLAGVTKKFIHRFKLETADVVGDSVGEDPEIVYNGGVDSPDFNNTYNTPGSPSPGKILQLSNSSQTPYTSMQRNLLIDEYSYLYFLEGLESRPAYIPMTQYGFCVPPNPVYASLYLRASLNLQKIRSCRNIAGVERQLEIYAAPTDTTTGVPVIGANGQIIQGGTRIVPASAYRYNVLIERARLLVSYAQQIENSFLSALEKKDNEFYNLLRARQDINIARSSVKLQELKENEASSAIVLAKTQREMVEEKERLYDEYINSGKNIYEMKMLIMYKIISLYKTNIIDLQTDITLKKELMHAAEKGVMTGLLFGGVAGLAHGLLSYFSIEGKINLLNVFMKNEIKYQERAQYFSFMGSHQREMDKMGIELQLTKKEIEVADKQIILAKDRKRITEQETRIAELQLDHSEAIVDFLINKFTGYELYTWMSNILESVYAYFLKEATSMARLAANQIAFERQETPPMFIQEDYWVVQQQSFSGMINGEQTDRRGLTGSSRLLMDITKLDQHIFTTDKRKLEITKSVSVSKLFPMEFMRFKENGKINFRIPMELFDRDYPGHYLRLIKSVNISVIALVPPQEGIKATFTSLGRSSVVIGNGTIFSETGIIGQSQSIVLSSHVNATGLFELRPDDPMLLPFEGLGVDTNWSLDMPKAANQFDYMSIADVILTINYTAMHNSNYKQQVISKLTDNNSIEDHLAISLRDDYPDQWYKLLNPEEFENEGSEEDDIMTASFELPAIAFPPNIFNQIGTGFKIMIARENRDIELKEFELRFSPETEGMEEILFNQNSITSAGILSSNILNSKPPFGTYILKLKNDDATRDLFINEKILDILFVISYEGERPPYE